MLNHLEIPLVTRYAVRWISWFVCDLCENTLRPWVTFLHSSVHDMFILVWFTTFEALLLQ